MRGYRLGLMRHVSLCLVIPFVLACGGPNDPLPMEIRVQGHVLAADDGSPITGALIEALDHMGEIPIPAEDTTDASGYYSLSFAVSECYSPRYMEDAEYSLKLRVTHPAFVIPGTGFTDDPYPDIYCTSELQIINVGLLRLST